MENKGNPFFGMEYQQGKLLQAMSQRDLTNFIRGALTVRASDLSIFPTNYKANLAAAFVMNGGSIVFNDYAYNTIQFGAGGHQQHRTYIRTTGPHGDGKVLDLKYPFALATYSPANCA